MDEEARINQQTMPDDVNVHKTSSNKKFIVLGCVAFALVIAVCSFFLQTKIKRTLVISPSTTSAPTQSSPQASGIQAQLAYYFKDKFIEAADKRESYPIQQFTPTILMDIFPGIQKRDFNTVDVRGGTYVFVDEKLILNKPTKSLSSDPDNALMDESFMMNGLEQLLRNIASRLHIELVDKASVDRILKQIQPTSPQPTPSKEYSLKSYEHPQLHFTLQYPSSWVLDTTQHSGDFDQFGIISNDYLVDNTEYPTLIDGSTIYINVIKTTYTSGEDALKNDSIAQQTGKSVKQITVDGQPAVQSDWTWEGTGGIKTYIVKNGYLYTITLSAEIDQENQIDYQKILESLRLK